MKDLILNNETKMPIMGLGTWKSSPGEVYQTVRWAIQLGYRHFDCAPAYGNEAEIGQALFDAMHEENIKREELFITSKLWNDAHEFDEVAPAYEKSLSDLKLDYLDLYLIHWPVAQKKNVLMPQTDDDMISLSKVPLDITWGGMEDLYKKEKVKAIGVSNFGEKHLSQLLEKAAFNPMVNQIELHPFLQQNGLVDFCQKNNIVVTAYSSLGTTHNIEDKSIPSLLENETITSIAKRIDATPAQVLLAWSMQRDCAVIPKSIHSSRLRENIAAINIKLDEEDMDRIAKLDMHHRYIDGYSFVKGDYTIKSLWE